MASNYIFYFDKLFKRLCIDTICNSNFNSNSNKKISLNVCTEDRDFYNNYYHKSKKYLKQCGGGTKKIKYKYEGYKFVIFEDIDSNETAYSIHYDDNLDNPRTCMVLLVDKEENIVYVDNISYYSNCVSSGMPRTKGGSLLLRMTIEFVKNVLQYKYNLKYIQLKDNSFIYCEQTKEKVQFDNFYMLSHGDTWYGKYGFIPLDIEKGITDYKAQVNYEVNKRLVDIVKVECTNLREYIKRAIRSLKLEQKYTEKKIDKMIDTYKGRSVKVFINDFVKNYDATCGMFANFYLDLMSDLKMTNMHGSTYYYKLS